MTNNKEAYFCYDEKIQVLSLLFMVGGKGFSLAGDNNE